jgi:hypothetical protein
VKIQKYQVGLKLNGTHQLLLCADDINLLGDSMYTIKKNTGTITDTSKEVGPEINAEKTKYLLLSHHQNAGQNHYIKIANILWKYGTVITFGNDSNKSRFDS